ncbi:MAG: zinc ribbon domain-containing protein [Acidimicrobiia bacterium]
MTAPRPRRRPTTARGNVISVTSDGPPETPYEEFSLEEGPPTSERAVSTGPAPDDNGSGIEVDCPSCGAVNPTHNRHCQECGARLRQGPLPTAPRPAVQATAGVRAALAISGLLLGVILIALFFNIFTGEDPEAGASTTTTATTIPQLAELGPIEILDQTCTPQGIGGLICPNLTSGTFGQGNEYQVSWDEAGSEGVQILFTFLEPMAITEIHWTNIEDATRFRQNYRAQSLTILAQDSLSPVPVRLQDQQGTQQVRYSALNTATLEIMILDVYQAELVDDNVFDELAIDEIVIIGRPVTPTTNTTLPGDGATSTTAGG